MARENSISDEADGRSLTPELDEEHAPRSPTYSNAPELSPKRASSRRLPSLPPASPIPPQPLAQEPGVPPLDRFRASVRKVIRLHRTTSYFTTRGIGAEPGVDPRRDSANLAYGHIRENCVIEVCDYSSVRSSFGKMNNKEFVEFMNDAAASAKEPWVKVRWINIAGISWDVISAVALKYGKLLESSCFA